MSSNFFDIYDAIADAVRDDSQIISYGKSDWWSLCQTDKSVGIAMTTEGDSISPLYSSGFDGLSLSEAAKAVKSWNLSEASYALAAANTALNTPEHIDALAAYEPYGNYCTDGLDMRGKTIGFIGHLHCPDELREQAKEVYIIERNPQSGDYPDAACELLLPRCDYVLITGSSLINKTLPRLLQLCANAYTILTGPSVPLCPALLDLGLDRIAGMAVIDNVGILRRVSEKIPGSPYPCGMTFLLKK